MVRCFNPHVVLADDRMTNIFRSTHWVCAYFECDECCTIPWHLSRFVARSVWPRLESALSWQQGCLAGSELPFAYELVRLPFKAPQADWLIMNNIFMFAKLATSIIVSNDLEPRA